MTDPSALSTLTARIARFESLVQEQLASSESSETSAALLDQWGRLHHVRATMEVGREPPEGLAIRQASVSRKHATLTLDPDADCWYVTDVGSLNGTSVDGAPLAPHKPARLADRALITFGDIGFVFVTDRATLPSVSLPPAATVQTQRRVQLVLHEPTTEGAGVVTFGEESVTLGSTQFALLTMLAERYLATTEQSSEVRGFVSSIELITGLPWNTAHPEDNHLKQQVRRLRRAFERIGLADVIESKQGFGYRLRIAPSIRR